MTRETLAVTIGGRTTSAAGELSWQCGRVAAIASAQGLCPCCVTGGICVGVVAGLESTIEPGHEGHFSTSLHRRVFSKLSKSSFSEPHTAFKGPVKADRCDSGAVQVPALLHDPPSLTGIDLHEHQLENHSMITCALAC